MNGSAVECSFIFAPLALPFVLFMAKVLTKNAALLIHPKITSRSVYRCMVRLLLPFSFFGGAPLRHCQITCHRWLRSFPLWMTWMRCLGVSKMRTRRAWGVTISRSGMRSDRSTTASLPSFDTILCIYSNSRVAFGTNSISLKLFVFVFTHLSNDNAIPTRTASVVRIFSASWTMLWGGNGLISLAVRP